jgi:malonate decarboxylase delta subunit
MAKRRLSGNKDQAIIGVVASGNLEVLLERVLPDTACEVDIATPLSGYDETWKAVVAEFVERASPGGLRISINDGGARPDTVYLRLMQGSALMEAE